MYETNIVEIDTNTIIGEDNCWGFNQYLYDRYIWIEEDYEDVE